MDPGDEEGKELSIYSVTVDSEGIHSKEFGEDHRKQLADYLFL